MKRVNSESNTKQCLSIAESCASSTTVKKININIDDIKRFPTVTNPIKADDLNTPQAYVYSLRRAIVTDCTPEQRAELVVLLNGKDTAEGVTFNNTKANRDRLHLWQNEQSRKQRAAILGEGWQYVEGLNHGTQPGDLVTCIDGTRGRVTNATPECCVIEFETEDGQRLTVAGYFRKERTPLQDSPEITQTAQDFADALEIKTGDRVLSKHYGAMATVLGREYDHRRKVWYYRVEFDTPQKGMDGTERKVTEFKRYGITKNYYPQGTAEIVGNAIYYAEELQADYWGTDSKPRTIFDCEIFKPTDRRPLWILVADIFSSPKEMTLQQVAEYLARRYQDANRLPEPPAEITEQREQNDACFSSAESRRDKAEGQVTITPDGDYYSEYQRLSHQEARPQVWLEKATDEEREAYYRACVKLERMAGDGLPLVIRADSADLTVNPWNALEKRVKTARVFHLGDRVRMKNGDHEVTGTINGIRCNTGSLSLGGWCTHYNIRYDEQYQYTTGYGTVTGCGNISPERIELIERARFCPEPASEWLQPGEKVAHYLDYGDGTGDWLTGCVTGYDMDDDNKGITVIYGKYRTQLKDIVKYQPEMAENAA